MKESMSFLDEFNSVVFGESGLSLTPMFDRNGFELNYAAAKKILEIVKSLKKEANSDK